MSSGSSPKMKDVAERCGISESTVSHALNGTKKVAAKTREKIEKAIAELKYFRDSDARRLARGKSNFLGLIISDIENPFYAGLIKAFETAAIDAGYEMLLCTTNYDPVRTKSAFRKMIENKSPGVAVMTSRVDPKTVPQLAEQGIVSVFLDAGKPGPLKSNLRMDYTRGVRGAINYLHNLGHRDFALVAGPQNRASHVAYKIAVELALRAWKLTPRVLEENNNVEGGVQAVKALLTEKCRPTAVLCSNDVTAMSVIRSFAKFGIRVPEDISVVGADDIPFAALTQPPLTTIRIPREQLGSVAMLTLHEMLTKPAKVGTESILETELVIRESTATVSPVFASKK